MSSDIAFGACDAWACSSSSVIIRYSVTWSPVSAVRALTAATLRRTRPPLIRVGLPLALHDEVAQALVHVEAPCTGAAIVALDGGHEADMGEADLRLVALLRDLEHDVGAVPLALVLHEVDLAGRDVPHDLLARHELGDLLRGPVELLVAVGPLGTERVRAAVDLSGPPPSDVVDRVEGFLRRLIDQDGRREILGLHDRLLSVAVLVPSEARKRALV